MARKPLFRVSAQQEREKFNSIYGQDAAARLSQTLQGICDDSYTAAPTLSVLFDPDDWVSSTGHLKTIWGKWLDAGIRDKVCAILHVLKTRTPPWSFRCATTEIEVVPGVSDEITVFFEVDHTNNTAVITMLDVPPRP